MTLCALAAFTVTSCKDEPKEPTPKPEEATLTVAPSSLSFGSASESKSLTVKSNKDWTVAVPSDASWLTASPMKGTGDGSVSVKAAANVGPDGTAAAAREAKISISIDGKKVDITVSQSAEAIVFVVNGDTATIPADGGKVAVSVEYNEAYTVGTLPEWITAGTKATKTDNLSFTVAANEAATERTGDITFSSASGKTGKVTVKQAAAAGKEPVIKTGDDLVAFFKDAENYKNPEYVVSFANDIDMNGLSIAPIDTLKCVIDGKNFSIKNWKCEKSAIALNVGTIKNIVIDSSCELVVNDGNSAFFVDKNQPDGVIDGVINNASASRTDAITAQFNFGFISCINYGLIKNCVNNGNLTVDVPSMAKSFVGGVCGYYNGSTNVKALGSFVCFDNCKNTGNISIRSEAKPGNAEIGGIVGGTSCAKLSESYARGDIENCENSGNISYGFNANDSGTYVNEGGVTGIIEGSIKNCKNSGKVSYTNPVDSPKNSTRAAVGGVASYVRFNAEDCVNSGEVFVQGSHGAGTADAAYAGNQANPSFAGVIAQIGPATADATSDYHILRCYNTGKVTIDTHMQSTNSTTFWFGGVCAFATVDVIECHNSGALDVTAGQKSFTVGGVVGKPYHVVKDCYNEGPIDFKYTNVAQNGAWGIYLGGVAGDVEASGQPFTGCENKAAGTISVEGDFNASTTWYSYVGGLVGRFNKQASEISGCKNSAPVTIKKPGYFRCGGLVGSVDTKLLKNCQNTGDVTVPAALNLAVSFPCIGGFVGHCAALDIQECSSNAKVNVEASNDSNISLFAGSVGNTAQVWNNNSFGGELTVTGAATANHVGIMLGGLIDVNDAAKTVTIGAEKANVVKAGSKINGTAVTEADCADVTKVCGYFMPDDAFKAKVVLAEGGVVLEGGSTPDVPGTTPDIPGVDYNNPGVTL